MVRIGELLPDAARGLGLEEELRLSRAMSTFDRLIAERVPSVVGACRVARVEAGTVVVEADAPIVAQELRLRAPELGAAFAATPAGSGIAAIRVVVGRGQHSAR
jgi:Dna[CI] antecedent DciA-like protein